MLNIIIYLIILALLLAKLELMVEGSRWGWASKLPCWRKTNKFIEFLLGKELTGYHAWLVTMFFVLFHSPFLFIKWKLNLELIVLGLFPLFWVLEDWFWFLLNDYYGLKNFKKGRIFWHKRWFLGLPTSYWEAIILSSVLLILGYVI